jgi:hypothetical protein
MQNTSARFYSLLDVLLSIGYMLNMLPILNRISIRLQDPANEVYIIKQLVR